MAYYVGTANSLGDLRAALASALTDAGWVEEAGDVIHKDDLYVRLWVGNNNDENTCPPNGRLIVQVGNGYDAATSLLTDASPLSPRIGPLASAPSSPHYNTWDWPAGYRIHVFDAPKEVYLVVNFNGSYWQHLCFGQSPAKGNVGTGNWVHAHIPSSPYFPHNPRTLSYNTISPGGSILSQYHAATLCPLPFFWGSKDYSYYDNLCSQVHGTEGANGEAGWSHNSVAGGTRTATQRSVTAGATLQPLMGTQPNSWNLEAVLLPVQVFETRPEGKVSLLAEMGHSRVTRNDYLPDGSVVTLGSDRWMIYPAFRRNVAARDAGRGVTHSGTVALAIRYDGP